SQTPATSFPSGGGRCSGVLLCSRRRAAEPQRQGFGFRWRPRCLCWTGSRKSQKRKVQGEISCLLNASEGLFSFFFSLSLLSVFKRGAAIKKCVRTCSGSKTHGTNTTRRCL
ncbi:unnamed protein product, partial [Arctogadus glacialis]